MGGPSTRSSLVRAWIVSSFLLSCLGLYRRPSYSGGALNPNANPQTAALQVISQAGWIRWCNPAWAKKSQG